MTFGRWLLIHSFSIFLLILFFLGYIYRDELKLVQAYEQLLNLDDKPLKIGKSESTDETIEVQEKSAQQSTSAITEKPEAEISMTEELPPAISLESKPTLTKPVFAQDEGLLKARKAYWDKDYQNAIRYYQQLINNNRSNPDYVGELGNIYYALNDYENAARQYFQAAMLLIDQGKYEQARLLVSPVTAMNRDLGEELKSRFLQ